MSPNYQNSKIYKIESTDGNLIYIGSTTKQYLSQRFSGHRNSYNSWENGKGTYLTSFELFQQYGIESCNIILLESYPCSSRDELRAREAFYIKSLDCVNKNIPGRTHEEYAVKYYKDNAIEMNNKKAVYRKANSVAINMKRKIYYKDNLDSIKQRGKQYEKDNAKSIRARKSTRCLCACGISHTRGNKASHLKSQKHINWRNNGIESMEQFHSHIVQLSKTMCNNISNLF